MEKQGWSLVVASTACTARQAWQGEQGCAQHRCKASLSLKASNQTRRPVQPNPSPTRIDSHDSGQSPLLDLTSLALFSASLLFGRFSFFQFTLPYWHDCSFQGHFSARL